jgi:hypothetical protein
VMAAFAVQVFLGAAPASAQEDPMDIVRTLNFRAGSILLGANLATINQTKKFPF